MFIFYALFYLSDSLNNKHVSLMSLSVFPHWVLGDGLVEIHRTWNKIKFLVSGFLFHRHRLDWQVLERSLLENYLKTKTIW